MQSIPLQDVSCRGIFSNITCEYSTWMIDAPFSCEN